MMQTASAFSSVQTALSFFVASYRTIAEWRAVVDRLAGFEVAFAAGRAAATRSASAGGPVGRTERLCPDRTRRAHRNVGQKRHFDR
jgi:ABC-type uncharacterized transport system fused permease/ATPase subunit